MERRTHFALVGSVVAAAAAAAALVLAGRSVAPPPDRSIPLASSSGVLLCDLTFDGADAKCVVDTGSSHLLLASSSCEVCASPTTLTEQSEPTSTLRYGTQRSDVSWRVGALRLGPVRVDGVRAAVAGSILGETRYNILGLAPGELQRALGPRFSVVFGSRPTLRLGGGAPRRKRGAVGVVPCIRGSAFYALRVSSVLAGGRDLGWSGRLIVDTGSNFLSVPPSLFSRVGHGDSIEIVLPTRGLRPPLRLTYARDQCVWEDGTPIVDDETPEGEIVLGSLFMRGWAVEFSTDSVSFSKIDEASE